MAVTMAGTPGLLHISVPMLIVPQILISDDDAAFRDVVCEGLRHYGFAVTATADGRSAMDAWDNGRGHFHLCVVDFHMPGANGLQVIQHVQSHPADDDFPVRTAPCVLMSAELTEPIRRQAELARAYRILAKPLRLRQLGEVVQSALREIHGWSQN